MAFLGVNQKTRCRILMLKICSSFSIFQLSSAIVPSPSVQELFLKVVVPGVVHLSFRLLVLILQVLDLCRLNSQVEPFQLFHICTKNQGFLCFITTILMSQRKPIFSPCLNSRTRPRTPAGDLLFMNLDVDPEVSFQDLHLPWRPSWYIPSRKSSGGSASKNGGLRRYPQQWQFAESDDI